MTRPAAQSSGGAVFIAHVFVVAALSTAAFMVTTAADLGAMGPLVIAEALYLAALAGFIELGLAARIAVMAMRRVVSQYTARGSQEA